MVTSPTGKGVIAMGGSYPGGTTSSLKKNFKAMFELTQSMKWTRLEQTLQIEHFDLLVIPIPDELVYEKVESDPDELVYEKVESEDKEHQCSLPLLITLSSLPIAITIFIRLIYYVVNKFVNFF